MGSITNERNVSWRLQLCRSHSIIALALFVALLRPATWQVAAQPQARRIDTAQQLRAALEESTTNKVSITVAITSNINFTEENWPGPPVLVTQAVTITSPYRSILDFCGQGECARPLINVTAPGSLSLQYVFLRNFLPPEWRELSGLGPVPALLSSNGGRITFTLVAFHFLPAVTWVFNSSDPRPPGFWAQQYRTAMADVVTQAPLQLEQAALYLVRYQTPMASRFRPNYVLENCYALMDLRSCYADNRDDTALVFCPYTLAESLNNPAIRFGRIFYNIGFDRSAFSQLQPVAVTQPKSYTNCPGAAPTVNLDGILSGITVQAPLELSGLRFRGAVATSYTPWPPGLPLLLSALDVRDGGSVAVSNSVVEVPDLPAVTAALHSLPGCCSPDPSRPNLRPSLVNDVWPSEGDLAAAAARMQAPALEGGGKIDSAWPPPDTITATAGVESDATRPPGFHISQWLLTMEAWQRYVASGKGSGAPPTSASWRFENVLVEQADGGNDRALCFASPLEQGAVTRAGIVQVANEAQLRAALVGARFIQITSDIKLTPATWPTGSGALVPNAGLMEIRGCHPVPGHRYTLDFSDIQSAIRVAGTRVLFQGDLRLVGVGWSSLPQPWLLPIATGTMDMSLVGAISLATNKAGANGTVECEGVSIQGHFATDGLHYADMLAVLHLNHITPDLTAANVTLHGTSGVTLGCWAVPADSTQAGNWVFTQTDLFWDAYSPPPSPTGGGSQEPGGRDKDVEVHHVHVDVAGDAEDIKKIVVPSVVVGGVLLIAFVVLAVAYVRSCRRQHKSPFGWATGEGSTHRPGGLRKSLSNWLPAGADGGGPGDGCGGKNGGDAASAEGEHAAVKMMATDGGGSSPMSNGSASGTKTEDSGGGVVVVSVPAAAAATATTLAAGAMALGQTKSDKTGRQRGPGAAGRQVAVDSKGLSETRDKGPLGDIHAVKQAIMAGRPLPNPDATCPLDDLVLQSVLGEGSYGRVYRALWRGTTVAVKVILLPAHMSGRQRHERMAVMEAAISSSLSHPNIVQTYTYRVETVEGAKSRNAGVLGSQATASGLPESSTAPTNNAAGTPAGQDAAAAGSGTAADAIMGMVAWEIRLVQEFCDMGSLRDQLNARGFFKLLPAAGAGVPISLPVPPVASMFASGVGAGGCSTARRATPSTAGARQTASGAATATTATTSTRGTAAIAAGGAGGPGAQGTPPGHVADAGVAAAPPSSPASVAAAENAEVRTSSSGAAGGRAAGGAPAGGGGGGGGASPGVYIVNLAAVLDTAIDVARALTHLHREGIVHADLKPRNVLLKGSTTDPRGFVAKVADFGLSMRLDVNETHVSNAFHGTLAYMAPETLLHGHVSRASDVYSFGILLYELYTGETAYRGVPKALIGHAITKDNLRPVFPAVLAAPFEYQLLACRCWESNPEIRPEFDFILEDLKRMRNRLCAPLVDGSSAGQLRPSFASGANAIASAKSRAPTVNAATFGLYNDAYAGGGGGGSGAEGGGRWGLPHPVAQVPQVVLQPQISHSDGERTLSVSASNSVSVSAMSATAGHSIVAASADTAVASAAAAAAGSVMTASVARQILAAPTAGGGGSRAADGSAAAGSTSRGGGDGGGHHLPPQQSNHHHHHHQKPHPVPRGTFSPEACLGSTEEVDEEDEDEEMARIQSL